MKLPLATMIATVMTAGCVHRYRDPHGEWERLGVRTVEYRVDHDTISGLLQGRFRAIRIDVDRAPLEMYDIRVRFADGTDFSPDIRHHFQEGGWSRVIDLPGDRRVIQSVHFYYRTAHRGEGRARVEVWGLR